MNNNDQQDAFSSQVRQKLEHYELPVGNHVWESIQSQLPDKSPFFSSAWKMAVVVAIVGIVGMFLYKAFDREMPVNADNTVKAEKTAAAAQSEKIGINDHVNNHHATENETKNLSVDTIIAQRKTSSVIEPRSEKSAVTRAKKILSKHTPVNNITQQVENQNIINSTIIEHQVLLPVENIDAKFQSLPENVMNDSGYSPPTSSESPVAYYAEKNPDLENVLPPAMPMAIVPDKFFSPNGDGNNDVWQIAGIDYYQDYVVEIYDRYGRLLLKAEGDFKGWDGKYRGYLLPSTDYWYVIKIDEIDKNETGSFSLIK